MMDSANLPSQTDLNSLYGDWSTLGAMQGHANQDLAAQFRDQAFKANQNDITRGALQNNQSAQMNPLLITQQGLTNTGLDLGNQSKTTANASANLDFANKQELNPDELATKREELHAKLGDAQYTTLSNRILQSHLDNIKSGDPDKIAQTGAMMDFLGGPIASRVAETAQKRGLGELQRITQQNVANTQGQTARDVAGINAGSKVEVAGIHANSSVQIAGIKQTLNQKLAQLNSMDQSNPEVARLTAQTRQDLATANAAYANAVSLEKLHNGELGRQGIPGAIKATGTPENPIVLK